MIAGTRQKTVGSNSYANDPLAAFGKAFVEAANNILVSENYDIFTEPARALRTNAVKESLREFFVNDYIDPNADKYMTADQIEEAYNDANEQFETGDHRQYLPLLSKL